MTANYNAYRFVQPDFTALFGQLANVEPPLRFVVRNGGNFRHDVAFVSSLMHDARCNLSDLRCSNGVFTISMIRDRWEMKVANAQQGLFELASIPSQLTISDVRGVSTNMNGVPFALSDAGEDCVIVGFDATNRNEECHVTIDMLLPGGVLLLVSAVVEEFPEHFVLLDQAP